MTAHCESCTYYDEHHHNAGKANQTHATAGGLCRFNPPISQPGPDAHGLWPVVGKQDWCGHYAHGAHHATHAA